MLDSTLIINLDAIVDNYNLLKTKLAKGTQCAAVVKANAYGLGIEFVAKALKRVGCKQFFVATLDEGITLRKHLPDSTIYILHGFLEGQEKECLAHNLVPILNDLMRVQLWKKLAVENDKKLPAILHVDTGMCRFGLSEDEAIALFRDTPELLAPLDIHYVMTHLACANDSEHFLNARQQHRFRRIQDYTGTLSLSLANSSGIFLGEKFHYDLVRPGAALYGVNPLKDKADSLIKNVVTVKAKILQLRQVTKNVTVGYGATCEMPEGSRIATLSMGYADGYFRVLSNKGYCYIANTVVPVIGRVSMDLIMIDVTKVPESKLHIGAEVEVIGKHYTVDDMAKAAGTTGYEVLTRFGSRFVREYKGAE